MDDESIVDRYVRYGFSRVVLDTLTGLLYVVSSLKGVEVSQNNVQEWWKADYVKAVDLTHYRPWGYLNLNVITRQWEDFLPRFDKSRVEPYKIPDHLWEQVYTQVMLTKLENS